MRKHLLILLLLTLLTRGVMYISYPLGGQDDNQAGQNFLINELVSGNFLIGNLRFNTGYPLVIAPVAWLAQPLGRFDDRAVLLVQVVLASLIPFLIYDILRQRRGQSEAFFVALVVALNPFGWQWAHLTLPAWLVAFCVVLALWMIHRGLLAASRLLWWVAGAGLVLGIAVLARMNLAPAVAVLGATFFLLSGITFRHRLALFTSLGVTSVGVLVIYLVLIQHPSTGTWSFSCIGSWNTMIGLAMKDVPIVPANGSATQRYYELVAREPRHLSMLADTYPLWREPGPWVSPEEQAYFLAQQPAELDETLSTVIPGTLFYYLGPCATDQLLRQVTDEAFRAYPIESLLGVLKHVGQMLVYQPFKGFDNQYLPSYVDVQFAEDGLFGFYAAAGNYYNGQIVWAPGIWLFSVILHPPLILFWLFPIALIWALWLRDWFYGSSSLVLLTFLLMVAIFARPEPRYYATLYPLTSVILGGFLYAAFNGLRARLRASGAARR